MTLMLMMRMLMNDNKYINSFKDYDYQAGGDDDVLDDDHDDCDDYYL